MTGLEKLTARPSRVIPTVLLALVVTTTGGLGIWIFGVRLFDGRWPAQLRWVRDSLQGVRFDDPAVIAIAVGMMVIGFVFIGCALVPGDPANREVFPSEIPGQTVMLRKDIARRIKRQVELIDGVGNVDASMHHRALDVVVATPVDAIDAVKQHAVVVVRDQLENLHPVVEIRPKVRVKRVR